ncbi:MAG: terminase family protein [Pseudomonadota bacterium]|nr:terminase family protein [Pseudomonadota bacterium]
MNNSTLPFTPSELFSTLKVLEMERSIRKNFNRLKDYEAYPKQQEFHEAGLNYRERLLMAGNQLGKTLCAGAETAMHVTGRYPDWWKGKVFDQAIHGWVAGVTSESTRDNPQRILYGTLGAPGTGMIPKDAIKDFSPSRGIADALDTLVIRHGGGADVQAADSIIGFKAYNQGREKWQGPTLQFVWFDEEPPYDIYSEGLTRTNLGLCPVFITFTPLLGMTGVVKRFLIDKTVGTHVTQMEIQDALHYSQEERDAIIASYPSHEREARARGIPTLGSGRVFPVDEEFIKVDAFEIPSHWPQIGGLDFGWDHPSAGVKLAWDRDTDTLYVTACHRAREQTPAMFAPSVRSWGNWLPFAWPHDGLQHDKGSGEELAHQYSQQGLKMLPERSTFDDGSNGLEAGVMEMLERMQTGRLKVFSHLNDWFEEFRLYHRKDGLIVKLNDDLLSATRYAMMMRRFAALKVRKFAKIMDIYQPNGWMG